MKIRISNSYNKIFAITLGIAMVFATTVMAITILSPNSDALAQSSNSSSGQASGNGTGIGNIKQMGKVVGRNSKIIRNDTNIGNPLAFQNFTKEHKVKAPTPQSIKALPLHPQLLKAKNMTSSASGGSNKTGS
jgi:hypothetical protein